MAKVNEAESNRASILSEFHDPSLVSFCSAWLVPSVHYYWELK
jgi:hypothetical protein